jgi:hypothetical protein
MKKFEYLWDKYEKNIVYGNYFFYVYIFYLIKLFSSFLIKDISLSSDSDVMCQISLVSSNVILWENKQRQSSRSLFT